MRILVVCAPYPPDSIGGYELECATVVEHLAKGHEVRVLTSAKRGGPRSARAAPSPQPPSPRVDRSLPLLTPDAMGSLRAPAAALRGVAVARDALAWRPELIYVWNGALIPHASVRVLADSGTPLAFRVCEHWFGALFVRDQFMRELLPGERGPARAAWAGACRAVNRLPSLRLRATTPLRTAVSWNSRALRAMVEPPPFVEVALERVDHAVPPRGDLYTQTERAPASSRPAAPEIAFVGRVTPVKGVAVAIEALAVLRASDGIPATLSVAGPEEGGHGGELRALAARVGVAEHVRWLGALAPERIAELLARASALIVPSVWDEPLGLVVIEGALARVPVVAADVGGIGEVVRDEEHALLFARGDARAAAAALARTVREDEQTAARVRRAFARAQDFRLGPYLQGQERFVHDALAALAR